MGGESGENMWLHFAESNQNLDGVTFFFSASVTTAVRRSIKLHLESHDSLRMLPCKVNMCNVTAAKVHKQQECEREKFKHASYFNKISINMFYY